MSQNKKKYTTLGTMMVSKDGTKHYIKFENPKPNKEGRVFGEDVLPLTLKNGTVINDGDIVMLQSEKKRRDNLVKEGKMTAEKAKSLEFLIAKVVLVEDADDNGSSDSGSDDINF